MRYDLAVTPNGRPADASPLGKGRRRLSDYEREIAHALIRKGHPKSEAIRIARGVLNRAAKSGRWGRHGKANPKTIAGAQASIAQRKSFSLSNFNPSELRGPDGRWVKMSVLGRHLQVGDRLDAGGKTRISKTHVRKGEMLVQHTTAGARSPSMSRHGLDEQVLVHRKVKNPEALKAAMEKVAARLDAEAHKDGGPDRIEMPQLSGVPAPGSKADKMFPDRAPGTEVDLADQFEGWLKKRGVSVTSEEVPSSSLKPTQDELVEPKVVGIAQFMETAPADSPVFNPIYVTKDGHVIDGHHRWAGNEVRNEVDGVDRTMKIKRVNASKAESLRLATEFMDEFGLPRVGMENNAVVSNFASKKTDLSNIDLTRHVRTPEGVRKFGLPIGSPIGGGAADKVERVVKKIPAGNPALLAEAKRKDAKNRAASYEPLGSPFAKTEALTPEEKKALEDDAAAKAAKDRTIREQRRLDRAAQAKKTDKEFGGVTVDLNGSTRTMPEAIKLVGDAYGWKDMDDEGSVDLPGTKDSLRQAHAAQIVARAWYSPINFLSDDDDQYAASVWDGYQNPDVYGKINATLRTGEHNPDEPDQKTLASYVQMMFDRGGYTTQKPMRVFRALKSSRASTFEPGNDEGTRDWSKELKPGTVFTDKGIISTTPHMRFAQGWLTNDAVGNDTRGGQRNDVIVEIRVPEGQRIVGGDPQFIETMLPPGTKLKVTDSYPLEAKAVNPLDHEHSTFTYTHVIAEVVPDAQA